MGKAERSPEVRSREKGAVLVLVAVGMAAFVGFAALAVDLGYMYVARNELQNVADGAALAATRQLGTIYQAMPYDAQLSYVIGSSEAAQLRATAQAVASANVAANQSASVRSEDVFIGQWDGDTFTATNAQPDAVRVIARRDSVANGPVGTFFARVFGKTGVEVTTDAIAALTGQSTAGPGDIELPIGISRWFFDNPSNPPFCDEDIQFYPTNDPASCAGWTSWEYGSNDITLRRILQETPGYESPEMTAQDSSLNFTGGTLSNPTFSDLLELFQRKGFDVDANGDPIADSVTGDPVHDATGHPDAVPLYERDSQGNVVLDPTGQPVQMRYPDGTPRNEHSWLTSVPVYDADDCANPNQSLLIVGFAEIELTDILDAPDKLVRGKLKCDYIQAGPARGGGGNFGLKGSIPGLVE